MLAMAVELAEKHGWFLCRQFENEANADVHTRTTAQEILKDFAGERLRREFALEVRNLADGAAQAQLRVTLNDGEPGRIVAAVLEPLQAFDEHGDDVALCNGADDAAHTGVSLLWVRAAAPQDVAVHSNAAHVMIPAAPG